MPAALTTTAIWLVPAAPLVACLWILFANLGAGRGKAWPPLVAALAVSFGASLLLLFVGVPSKFQAAPVTTSTAHPVAADASHPAGAEDAHASGAEDAHATVVGEPLVYDIPGFSPWIKVGSFHVDLRLRVDALTAIMLVMITFVSLLVAIFSSDYMSHDAAQPRFFAAMALFVFSMCMLVMSSNFLMLFIFWEAVGLCSYLLIGFWYTRPAAAQAATKAFIVNRIGDFGLLLAMFLLWSIFGTLDMPTIFAPGTIAGTFEGQTGLITPLCLLLFLGAVGKSAQFPLHVWLPDAMEGPTPVSALIHAATMVTAGVYLVARCAPLFVLSPIALQTIAATGAVTAILAAFTALSQYDLKRVLAYSTVSQLGYMFMSLGAAGANPQELMQPAVTFAIFHMFTHAFFKAVLFLSAGSVMHSMGDVIDMRRFSGLRATLPTTHLAFLCGAAALAGFPLLSGFWSKDEIIALLRTASLRSPDQGLFYLIIFGTALVTSLMTAFYTFRAYFLTFHGPERFPAEAGDHPHEATPAMAYPLLILAAGAVLVGVLLGPTHLFAGYLHTTRDLPASSGPELGLNLGLLFLGSLIALLGIGAAWLGYGSPFRAPYTAEQPIGPLAEMSQSGLFLDAIYHGVVVGPLQRVAALVATIDRYVVAPLVTFFAAVPRGAGALLGWLQGGMVQSYAALMLLGLTVGLVLLLMQAAAAG